MIQKYSTILLLLFSCNILAQNTEARIAPLALLARWFSFDLSLNTSKHWSYGPSGIYYGAPRSGNMFIPSYNGFALGGHVYYYYHGFDLNSWYWGVHAFYERFESYPHAFNGHYELNGTKVNTKVGYRILSSSSLSFLFGLGLETRNYSQDNIANSSLSSPDFSDQSGLFPFLEAKMAYRF